ncbi:MAG: outer membrane beta-barrel protein [Bacteroidetes bacterium]|nr:outer membrane beta-barrel protein [Bacteroidota bacterium]
MKTVFSSLLFSLFFIGTVSAQTPAPQTEPDFLTGKGLLFKFDGLANLGLNSFSGGVGLKYKIGEEAWLRHIVIVSTSRYNPKQSVGRETEYFNLNLGLSTDYIIDMYKRNNLKPYYGAGFSLSTGLTDNYSKNPSGEYSNVANYYSAEIVGLVGIEYFVKDNISLSAEYQLGAGFSYTENKTEMTSKPSNEKTKTFSIPTRGFYLNTSSFGLVASFYL